VEDNLAKNPPTPEVTALCTLLARILYRSLAEQDPRALALLSSPAPVPTPQSEQETSNHAA